MIEKVALPDPTGFDPPDRLDAFLDAVRWGASSSADVRTIQAPFRSGIDIEDYQLDPVVRAIQMPRVNFHGAVVSFLAFHAAHADLADRLAHAITTHATPVGSGTVARTKRITIQQRAEAAVIAWMRRLTTAYDSLPIPRVKGKRRALRRQLAGRSRALLDRYRRGEPAPDGCPLQRAAAAGSPGAA